MTKTICYIFKILFICHFLFTLSCVNESHDNESHDEEPNPPKGSVVLNLDWNTNTDNPTYEGAYDRPAELVLNDNNTINCTASKAAIIYATVYDQANDEILSENGAGWDCLYHKGILSGVPAGVGRKLVCYVEDDENNVLYYGQLSDVTTVSTGKRFVQIKMNPFFSIPSGYEDDAKVDTGTLLFGCGTVQNAAGYQLQVAIDINFENIIADQSSETNQFEAVPAAASGVYYWRVRVFDKHGLEGVWSTPRTLNVTNIVDLTQDDNCVGAWRMDANANKSETDISGSAAMINYNTVNQIPGDDTTLGSSTSVPSGYAGKSRHFNGRCQLFHRDNESTDIHGTAISLGAWVYIEKRNIEQDRMIIGKGIMTGIGDDYQYNLYFSQSHGTVIFGLSSNGSESTRAESLKTLKEEVWTHVFAVYDGSDMRIYVNGVLDANGSDNPKTFSSEIYDGDGLFRIGGQGGSKFWYGLIDEPIVFDRALSANEVLNIYKHGIAGDKGNGDN